MKYNHNTVIFIFLLTTLIACSKNKDVLNFSHNEDITGSWSETFDWEGRYPVFIIEENMGILNIERTSTLTFAQNRFFVKILPPLRVLQSKGDSIFTSLSDDTLYTGQYAIISDTLKFYLDNKKESEIFNYVIKNDSLILRAPARADTNGFMILPTSSFLWANSVIKVSGKFIRIE